MKKALLSRFTYMLGLGTKYPTILCALLLVPTFYIFFLMLEDGYLYCCDANNYLSNIAGYKQNGLYHETTHLGYRAYLFEYFYSFLPLDLSRKIIVGDSFLSVFSFVAVGVLLMVEFAVLRILLWGTRYFWVFYVAIFLNPLVMSYVPFPLQESFVVLLFVLFVPLIYTSFIKNRDFILMISIGLFFSSMFMVKASGLLLAFPAFLFAAYVIYKSKKNQALLTVTLILSTLPLVIPQSMISMKYLSTLNPYPNTAVLSRQFQAGDAYTKYNTNLSGSKTVAVPQIYWNPLECSTKIAEQPRRNKEFFCTDEGSIKVDSLAAIFDNNTIEEVFFKASMHIFNALNYDYLRVYVTDKYPGLFSWHQLLSMLIFFFGFQLTLKRWLAKTASAFDLFLDGVMFVSLGVLLFIAVETRFGILATSVLSLNAVEFMVNHRPKRSEVFSLVFGAVSFIFVASLLSIYVLSYSGALSRP